MGRGLDHFRKEGAKLVPQPTEPDWYLSRKPIGSGRSSSRASKSDKPAPRCAAHIALLCGTPLERVPLRCACHNQHHVRGAADIGLVSRHALERPAAPKRRNLNSGQRAMALAIMYPARPSQTWAKGTTGLLKPG